MNSYFISFIFLQLFQLSFQFCHYSTSPTLQNGKCNCSSQFYYDSGFCQICPSNSFANSNAISQSQCSTCISNLFYLSQLATASSSAICIKCPNNTQTGTSYPTNIQDESECSLCQPGFYMQQASIPPSNGVQGKSAVCVQCPNNSSSLNFQSKVGVQFCNICQQGYYISQPATDTQPAVCLPCSSNTTNKYDISSPKQNNINDCVACAANYYPTQSNPLICQKCPNNTISNPAAFSISNCMCQPNYYMAAASSSTAAATCFPCPNGSGNYFSPIFPGDASQCDICQSGYYLISPFQDGNPGISAQCQKCPNNSTSNPNISTNVSICSLCPQNYFMQAASTSTNSAICQPCPNGSGNKIAPFQPGDESQCNICQAGYYLIQSQLNQNPKKAAQCQKCPFNSMSDIGANFISNCSQCPQNYYMQTASTPLTSATCQPCPGGSGNQQAPSIQGDLSQCNICQTGYYLIQPSSTGQATQCQQCPNNSTSDPGSLGISSCSMCLKNFYMQIASTLTTSAICQPCPTGSGTQAPVSQVGDVSQCNICKAGYVLTKPLQAGQAAQCNQCTPGSSSEDGIGFSCNCYDQNASWSTLSNSCKCNPGYFGLPALSLGQTGCTPCPIGQYYQSGICLPCPAGSFSNQPGSTSCTQCSSNTYASGTGNISCQSCPSNSTVLADYSGCQCIDASAVFINNNCVCPQGFGGTASSQSGYQGCEICPSGQYSNLTTSYQCTPCSQGTYSSNDGSTTCQQCNQGYFASSIGNKICQKCGTGSTNLTDFSGCYCYDTNSSQISFDSSCICNQGYSGSPKVSQNSSSSCIACQAGYFVNPVDGNCSKCPSGTYSNGKANQNCIQCLQGQYASGTGNTSCKSCPDKSSSLNDFSGCQCIDISAVIINNYCVCPQGYGGTVSSIKGQIGCSPCPAGQYSNSTTSGQCSPCPQGFYSFKQGSSKCQQCNEGQYAQGQGNTQCQDCGTGLTNTSDFSGCYCIDPYSTQLEPKTNCVCNEGYIGQPATSKESPTRCHPCSAGYYADKTSGNCLPCPAGTYSNGTANSKCIQCGIGQFAIGKQNKICVDCAAGSTNTVDFTGCQCYDQNAAVWQAVTNQCVCAVNFYGSANQATSTQNSLCIQCPNNSTSKAGAAKTQKDCLLPNNQQINQISNSSIIQIALLILAIIF